MGTSKWASLLAALSLCAAPRIAEGAPPGAPSQHSSATTTKAKSPPLGTVAAEPEVRAPSKAKTAPDDEPPKPATDGTKSEDKPDPLLDPNTNTKKDGTDSLALGAPRLDDSVEAGKLSVHPYFLISGGLKADFVKDRPGENKNDRVSTFALGRIGVRARYLDFVYAESEFMASGGVGLHGTSAYEGQAAMQVRQQLIRLSKWGLRLEVGRIVDEASVDFFSAHVTETFLQDTAIRDPLLFTGLNLGNGIRLSSEVFPGLRVGLHFNAANPVSTTSSLLVGGGYAPFDRFYIQPYQQVNQSANHFPDDTFHIVMVTPSVLVDTKVIDARLAAQFFDINANTNASDDEHIRGFNFRGTVRVKLLDNMVIPFFSAAYTKNDTLVQTNLALRSPDRYQAVNVGGGVDLDLQRRYRCAHDCADGVGAQYQQVQFQIGDGLVTTQRYVNVGGTYWLAPNVSVGLRFAMWMKEEEQQPTLAGVQLGQTRPDIFTNGERSMLATLRFIMQ